MSKNDEWLVQVVGVDPRRATQVARAARQTLRTEKIVFSRWSQVMVRFEHGMYTNPNQDLSKLWWDLKKRYQLANPPDDPALPGYGAKMHITGSPVYYHNYMLGDLFASQMQFHIARNILKVTDPVRISFTGRTEVGDYLRREVFAPGKLSAWSELTKRATGELLTAKYFAAHFVD
jgi:peptidyl-dipeptidase A